MSMSLLGDAIVAVLLIATISYAAVLNARLSVLRKDRAKLEELIQGLTVASQRAESGITALRSAAEDVGRRLERKIEEGARLRDDLTYMLERGGGIADRLEGTIRARRDDGKPEPAAPAKRDAPLRAEPKLAAAGADAATQPAVTQSRAERELLRALSGR
jgi:hypothetical protein